MRNLPKLLFQRVVVVSLGILLQILFVVAGMDWLREYWHWVRIAMGVISWVAVLTIMTGRSNPSYKMAWVVLILVIMLVSPSRLRASRSICFSAATAFPTGKTAAWRAWRSWSPSTCARTSA